MQQGAEDLVMMTDDEVNKMSIDQTRALHDPSEYWIYRYRYIRWHAIPPAKPCFSAWSYIVHFYNILNVSTCADSSTDPTFHINSAVLQICLPGQFPLPSYVTGLCSQPPQTICLPLKYGLNYEFETFQHDWQ